MEIGQRTPSGLRLTFRARVTHLRNLPKSQQMKKFVCYVLRETSTSVTEPMSPKVFGTIYRAGFASTILRVQAKIELRWWDDVWPLRRVNHAY